MSANKFVIRRRMALGDVIWVLPLVQYLHTQHPGAEVSVVTDYPQVFDGVCLSEPYGAQQSPNAVVINLDGAYERRRHLHIGIAYFEEMFSVLGIRESIGNIAEHLKYIDETLLRPELVISEASHEAAIKITGHTPYVVIHAAAVSPDRIWSAIKYEALAKEFLACGYRVFTVGSKTDFRLGYVPGVFDAHGLDFKLSAALIAGAEMFFGADSGMSHVAFATNTKACVLYGMAEPQTRMPLDDFGDVGLSVSPSTVSCVGCLRNLHPDAPPLCSAKPEFRGACMDALSIEYVVGAVEGMLDAGSK